MLTLLVCWQDDFRTVEYALIGDDSAPQFFEVNAQTGQITTSSSLERETTELYRVSIQVFRVRGEILRCWWLRSPQIRVHHFTENGCHRE